MIFLSLELQSDKRYCRTVRKLGQTLKPHGRFGKRWPLAP
ncbi:hypothetical protein NEICINOT_05003 [Neisseria cinerea ATCC 14685]|uniref:Uncharacterized protein n=1 Tax=Neisseria cinerea ATCC 14685 TaxID=546262 RepID=D0W5N3_NEICI|nr:hypothetical protein NEICINOT_05003 [Neisseria cinerea ATCC 14685]